MAGRDGDGGVGWGMKVGVECGGQGMNVGMGYGGQETKGPLVIPVTNSSSKRR